MTSRHLPVLQQLLPAEGYDPKGPVLVDELEATGQALDDLQDNAALLFMVFTPEEFPQLLPLFEKMFSLPDRCDIGIEPSIAARFAAVRAKESSQPDCSIPYLIQYAEKLGYSGVTITKIRRFSCGDPCGRPLYGEMHRFMIDVHVPADRPVRYFMVGDPCQLPLRMMDDMRIECAFRRLEPADTLFRFFYGE